MSVLGSLGFGSDISITVTRVGLKPGCTWNKSQKLRSRSPAAIISTRERANSPITKAWRKRERRREPLEPRPSWRRVSVKLRRLVSHAGASPKIVPAATETTMANASTPQLMDMSLRRGKLSGTNCSRNFRAQKRTAKSVMPLEETKALLNVAEERAHCDLCVKRSRLHDWKTSTLSHTPRWKSSEKVVASTRS